MSEDNSNASQGSDLKEDPVEYDIVDTDAMFSPPTIKEKRKQEKRAVELATPIKKLFFTRF